MIIIENGKPKLIINIILIALEVLLGVLLLVVPAKDIISVCLSILGVLLIVLNVFPAISYYKLMQYDKRYQVDFISALITVIFGVLLLVVPGIVLSIILTCWFIVMPILRIVLHQNHKEQFKKEIPYLVIGLLMMLFSFSFIADIIVKVLGVIILLTAVSHLIYAIFSYKKINDIERDDNIIDAEIKDL